MAAALGSQTATTATSTITAVSVRHALIASSPEAEVRTTDWARPWDGILSDLSRATLTKTHWRPTKLTSAGPTARPRPGGSPPENRVRLGASTQGRSPPDGGWKCREFRDIWVSDLAAQHTGAAPPAWRRRPLRSNDGCYTFGATSRPHRRGSSEAEQLIRNQ